MKGKLFDTNILVYAYDTSEAKKHENVHQIITEDQKGFAPIPGIEIIVPF